jgi:N-acyl-D-aspartate/D-glutamate deacylase
MSDLLITNAIIYDGSGGAPFEGEIAVRNDKIQSLGKNGTLPRGGGVCVFDAVGAALCPGFIDVHSHSDAAVLRVPTADSKISQGVTTEIVGNCGFSDFVYSKRKNALGDPVLEECDGTFASYADLVEKTLPAVNIAALCGHNSLRLKVMGYAERRATADEIAQMKELLAQSLRDGAAGFSSGLWYLPGLFSDSAEVQELAALLRGTGKPYSTHMRSEGDRLLESLEEAIGIARCGSGSLQISHFKTGGKNNWGKIDRALSMVEEARRQGMKVLADRYPYIYSSTSLRMAVPSQYTHIDNDSLTEMLKNSEEERAKLQALMENKDETGKRNNWERIIVVTSPIPEHKPFFGLNMLQIAENLQLSPAAAFVKLLSEGSPSAAFGSMCEENLHRFLAQSWVITGSDGSIRAFSDSQTHPRAFGTFPRFFQIARKYATDAEVIRRMTSLPAEKFQLVGRGRIAPGYFADLVLFEPEKFQSQADYAVPNRICEGILRVYVNGGLAYSPDTNSPIQRHGRMLRIR